MTGHDPAVCRSLLFERERDAHAMATDLIELALVDFGEHFARYRLRAPAAERALEASLHGGNRGRADRVRILRRDDGSGGRLTA